MSYPWVESGGLKVAWTPDSYGSSAPAVTREIRNLPHEIRDDDIERDKPGFRGLFLAQFQEILARCDRGDPDDPRWDELRLRCLDRMAKLLRVYEPDAPAVRQGPGDARSLAAAAALALSAIEESLAETRVA